MAHLSLQSVPALRVAVLFAAGILFGGSSTGSLIVVTSLVLALLGFLAVPSLSRTKNSFCLATLSVCPLLLCVFLGVLGARVDADRDRFLPDSAIGAQVVLSGAVIEQFRKEGDRYLFVVESSALLIDSVMYRFASRVMVRLKAARANDVPAYGSAVLLMGTMGRPRNVRNPGEFNQRRYYLANGISWILTIRNADDIRVVSRGGGMWFVREVVLPVRASILRQIDEAIGGQEGEYLKGVLLGERGGLLPEVRAAFTAAGVAHILAVSGGNVAVVVAFIYSLADLLRVPRRVRPLAGCLGIVFYMLLVGYQPPVIRATIMALVMLIGTMLEERPNPVNSLGVSALIILGLDTRQLYDVGFQLSFLAVLSIILLYPIVDTWLTRRIPGTGPGSRASLWLLRVCAVSFVAGIGTLPLTASYFGRVSLIGVLTNIAVVPASGFSLILGFLGLISAVVNPWAAGIYHLLNQLILRLTLELTLIAGNLPIASIDAMRFETVDAFPFYAALLLVFFREKKSFRGILFCTFLFTLNLWVFLPRDPALARTERLRISFLDVGQGDATLLEFPDGPTILVDAGPLSGAFDSGSRIVVPFLKRRGIGQIHLLVATHPHNDHIGGIPSVLKETEVLHVMDCGHATESSVFRAYQRLVGEEHSGVSAGRAGLVVEGFPGARLYVLAPETGAAPGNINNSSVVLKLVYGSVSVLLTGDAEDEAERLLVERYGAFLRSTLLKVGHHGSSTSSTDAFRAFVDPDIAVVSVGTPNLYRHPSQEILAHYREERTQVLRTDEEGAIIFETDGEVLERIVWNEE